MIIWSGWGFLVVPFFLLGGLVSSSTGDQLESAFDMAYGHAHAIGSLAGGAFAAILIFLFARWRDNSAGQVFIDAATGERLQAKNGAGSFFFIPMRYWTWIVFAVCGLSALRTYPQTASPWG
jgi:hypothetical protein